eukprot:759839-Hanusia_phi.AAC.3
MGILDIHSQSQLTARVVIPQPSEVPLQGLTSGPFLSLHSGLPLPKTAALPPLNLISECGNCIQVREDVSDPQGHHWARPRSLTTSLLFTTTTLHRPIFSFSNLALELDFPKPLII